MAETYGREFFIGAEECDLFGRCRMSNLLQFMQLMATEHAEILGFGRELLMEKYGCFWMLVRVMVSLKEPVPFNGTLKLVTWPRPIEGAAVYRDYDIFSGGRYVGEATASWVTANYESRKLVVPKRLPEVAGAKTPDKSRVKTIKLQKLRMPESMEKICDYRVRYSDTDVNGHMNNVKYADVICDALDMQNMEGLFLSGLELDYISECRAGDSMEIFASNDGGRSCVSGVCGGVEKFASRAEFSEV